MPPPLPHGLRRAASLALTFALAKVVVVAVRLGDGGGAGLLSALTPLAFAHEDLWVVLGFALFDRVSSALTRDRPAVARAADRGLWTLYAVLALYAAGNVPITRVFSTPLTYQLMVGTGGALGDSIAANLRFLNLASVGVVLAGAAFFPRFVSRLMSRFPIHQGPARRGRVIAFVGLAIVVIGLGPAAVARVETLGLHRNAVFTLVRTALAQRSGAAWTAPSPGPELVPAGDGLPLPHLRGAAAGRNVIVVVLESTAAQYLRIYGSPVAAAVDPTPNLTRLAGRAVVLESAYTVYPESIKTLYALFCSAEPAAHTTAAHYRADRLPCAALPERFAAAGYRTALFHSGRFVYLGMNDVIRDRGFHELHDAASIGGAHASSFGVDEASTVARLLAFIDGLPPGGRFFTLYLPIAGHHPYASPGAPPGPFGTGAERDRYLNDLCGGDAALGVLMEGIRARGLEERTLWAVIGDHGEAFFQHEGNFAHSLFLYEENVRVPLLLGAPGLLPRQIRAPQVASLVDLGPTLLDLVGLAAPAPWRGQSLLGGRPSVARFFTDYGQWQLGLRDGPWKLIHDVESGRSKLYNLTRDPDERRDLAAALPDRAARYRDHLIDRAARARANILGPAR